MTAIEQKVIRIRDNGTPIIEAFIISNSTPTTFPKTGEGIVNMEPEHELAPFSTIFVVGDGSLYIANEDVDFIKQ